MTKPLWKRIVALGDGVPDSELAAIPPDLSANVDHYLYGADKQPHDHIADASKMVYPTRMLNMDTGEITTVDLADWFPWLRP